MKKENVYLYTRVSTAIQTEGYSLDAQREKIINYCKYREFNVVGEYSDAGFSGKNIAGRKQFQQMLEDIANKKDDVKYVLVFKLSRFGRNAADVLSSLQFMQDYGVNLICVEDNIDSSAGSGKVLISVMSAIAEIERENILVQTMAGRKQKAAQGGWNGGFAPYGYDLVNGQLIVQEAEAAAVREMYDLYAHTAYGPSVIAKEINKKYKKIPRANGHLTKFTMNNVKDILDNPVYMGKIAFGRHTTEKIEGKRNEFHIVKQKDDSKVIIADGTHQPIVSEELWNEVHEKRVANSKTKEKIDVEHDYYLSGLVKCPSCGCSMYGIHNGRKKKKDGTYYPMSYSYACRAASVELGVECPDPKNYSENRLMEAVTAIIKQLVNDKNFEKMVDVSIGMKADINVLEQEKAERQKELQRLNRLITQLENQLDTLDYSSKASALKEKSLNTRLDRALEDAADCQGLLDDVEERMSKIVETEATKKMIYDFLESFDVMFDVLSSSDKKDLLKMMIEKIELYPRDNRSGQWIKTIHFKFPMYYNDDDTCSTEIHFDKDGVFQPKERIVESVVILSE